MRKTFIILALCVFMFSLTLTYSHGDEAEKANGFERAKKLQKYAKEKLRQVEQKIVALLRIPNIGEETRSKLTQTLTVMRKTFLLEKMDNAITLMSHKLRFDSMEKVDEIIAGLQSIIKDVSKIKPEPSPLSNLKFGLPLKYKKITVFPIYNKTKDDNIDRKMIMTNEQIYSSIKMRTLI